MRFYGKRSGRNNTPRLLVRSYKFNNRSRKDTKVQEVNEEKEKTFLQKKSFEEYNGIDWFCYIIFIIGAIIIVLTSFN